MNDEARDGLSPIQPGTRVRLIDNPARTGVVTKVQQVRNGYLYRQVQFPDARDFLRESALEPLPEAAEHPVDLLEKGSLSDVAALRRALTHVRLTGKLSDVIYSMEATNTDFFAFQFKPVLKMLQSPVNGILVADEVGLGKTIEAGLIWTELRSRIDANRLLVVCPGSLREKWQAELSRRFGVRADIANAREVTRALRDPQSRRAGFALIGSIQGLRRRRSADSDDDKATASEELIDLLEARANDDLIDLLVIDEAHHMRNPERRSHELGSLLSSVAQYRVLLTATPIHNKNNDLHAILQLLDRSVFRDPGDFEAILEANEPLVAARENILSAAPSKARLRDHLEEAMTHRLLQGNRQLATLRASLSSLPDPLDAQTCSHLAWKLETVNLLGHVVTRTRKRDVQEHRVLRDPKPETVVMTATEVRFYERVTQAVVKYCEGRQINERFLLVTPQRQVTSSMPAALRAWRRKEGSNEVESLSWREPSEKVDAARSNVLGPLVAHIVNDLACDIDLNALMRDDTKYHRLREVLQEFWRQNPDAKVILFSTFRATLAYLHERLEVDGVGSSLLWGGGPRTKDEVITEFRNDPKRRILLSSEVGGEGLDLQFCWLVINYDLPWNPMRVEQRIGRVDRLGQTEPKVLIWNLFYGGTIDERIYARLYEKLDLCSKALGDFEPLIGEAFEKLGLDLLTSKLNSREQEDRIEQTRRAIENKRLHEEHLENEAQTLVAYGDYVIEKIRAAKQMQRWITPQDLLVYASEFLVIHGTGSELRHIVGDHYELTLSAPLSVELGDFIRRTPGSRPTELCRSRAVRVLFENSVAVDVRGGAEVISQFHPLIRFATMRMAEDIQRIRPAAAVDLREVQGVPVGSGEYAIAAARWSSTGVQTVERLVYAGCRIEPHERLSDVDTERLVGACVADGIHWHEAAGTLDLEVAAKAAGGLFAELDAAYERARVEMEAQNNDRADVAQRSLEHHIEHQRTLINAHIQKHREMGNKGLVVAAQNRLDGIEAKIRQKLEKITRARTTDHRRAEVIAIVVRV